MKDLDIRTDTYTNSTPVKKMRLTYIPTGESVSGQGSSLYKLRIKLRTELSKVITERQLRDAETLRSIKPRLSCLEPGGERITSDHCIDGHRIIQTEEAIYVTAPTIESYGFPFERVDDDDS